MNTANLTVRPNTINRKQRNELPVYGSFHTFNERTFHVRIDIRHRNGLIVIKGGRRKPIFALSETDLIIHGVRQVIERHAIIGEISINFNNNRILW